MRSMQLSRLRPAKPTTAWKPLIAIGCLAIWALAMGTSQCLAQGQTLNWINTDGLQPLFDISTNWDPNSTPMPADSTFFSEDATYEVLWDDITGDRTVNTLGVFRWRCDVPR